jgi:hypothetical protein
MVRLSKAYIELARARHAHRSSRDGAAHSASAHLAAAHLAAAHLAAAHLAAAHLAAARRVLEALTSPGAATAEHPDGVPPIADRSMGVYHMAQYLRRHIERDERACR